MQYAVGAPLPPPHGAGRGSEASGAADGQPHHAQRPGPYPGTHSGVPVPPQGPPPPMGPPPPQGPPPPLTAPAPPIPGGPPPGHGGHHPVPGWGAPPPPSAQPRPDATGHVQLPPGGPVHLPSPPPADSGTGAATLAVLLIGPAGAGKTTVARHWATRRRVPTAHISLDDVREWVCSGFADPQSGWNDHSEAQYRLARRTCGFAARNFLANGISCILDDAVFPDRPVVGLGGWKRHVGPGLLPVVLLPGLEIVLERNAERSGNRRLSDEEVATIHGRMAGWYGSGLPIIDNSKYDVETTARALDEVLARAIASPPSW
ncbi:AAA family ATPase [Streptomyces albipurpureus]|uniref:ATP-binding protein n=1 Tax=Streptomyces albipurpureus TaxID=2897419 RepID=A0ABT0UW33_9ACTN|nr:AAA family ATPase [Streptomyces sp. CWNU-1]MCM2392809.1 ATP-binding protein [Streptomyces sp. CWNU-1]